MLPYSPHEFAEPTVSEIEARKRRLYSNTFLEASTSNESLSVNLDLQLSGRLDDNRDVNLNVNLHVYLHMGCCSRM